jgi:hypothetical protein
MSRLIQMPQKSPMIQIPPKFPKFPTTQPGLAIL